jgi:hypothetical protein
MPIYWSSKQVPELAELTPSQRREVRRACYVRHGTPSRRWYLGIAAYCVCVAVPIAFWWRFHDLLGFPLSGWPSTVALALGVCAGTFVRIHMLTSYLRPFYANYVKTELRRDVATPACSAWEEPNSMEPAGGSRSAQLAFGSQCRLPLAARSDCSPTTRARRPKLKSRRADLKVAQGKRGTSALFSSSCSSSSS